MSDEIETPVVPKGTETPPGESETPVPESDVPAGEAGTETPGKSDTPGEEIPAEPLEKEGEIPAEESDTPAEEVLTGNKAKKKIGKMTLKLKTLEGENERLRAAAQEKSSGPTSEPKEEDYADYAEYEDAKLDWKLDQREAKRAETDKQNSAVNEANERQEGFHKKADVVRESKEDFDEVAMSPDMLEFYANDARHVAEIIEGHDRGPEIAYYLGSNPEIAVDLAKMSNLQAAVTIGEIGMKLSTAPKLKSVSQAPTPITPTGAKGGGDLEKDSDKMSHKEWLEWRRKNKKIA